MKKVVRYQCEWCGKEFRTPDRHQCKWDPKWKNCLSCANRGKFVKGEAPRASLDGWEGDGISNGFECAVHGESGQGGWNDFDCGAVSCAVLGCPDWKKIKGYNGKETFKKIESERRLAENPGEFKDLAEFHSACEGHRETNDNPNYPFPF